MEALLIKLLIIVTLIAVDIMLIIPIGLMFLKKTRPSYGYIFVIFGIAISSFFANLTILLK